MEYKYYLLYLVNYNNYNNYNNCLLKININFKLKIIYKIFIYILIKCKIYIN